MSEAHIDSAVLTALRDVMEDEFPVLLDTFIADSGERLRQFHQAIQQRDAQALRLSAHSFKGSCSNMGALPLASLCRRLEELAKHDQLDEAPPLIESIEQEFALVNRLLDAERRR